jgi:hypothetical protein
VAPVTSWHIITGEYPPDPGGVADYTAVVARALVAAGHEVHVWCRGDAAGPATEPGGVRAHRVAGRFGPTGLARIDRELGRFDGPRTVLVQYAPHAFGWKAMNLPLAAWAEWRARRGDDVRVMFHEVTFPWVRRPLRHNVLAAANRVMAAVLVRACSRAYVSIPGWIPLLRRLGAGRVPIAWTPVPSNVPGDVLPGAAEGRRAEVTGGCPFASVVGHFGTYGPSITRYLARYSATSWTAERTCDSCCSGPVGIGGGGSGPAGGRAGPTGSSRPVPCPRPRSRSTCERVIW